MFKSGKQRAAFFAALKDKKKSMSGDINFRKPASKKLEDIGSTEKYAPSLKTLPEAKDLKVKAPKFAKLQKIMKFKA